MQSTLIPTGTPPQKTIEVSAAVRPLKVSRLAWGVGITMLLLTLLAHTDRLNAAPAAQGGTTPGGTLPLSGVILLSLGSSGELESDNAELEYRDEDIISYVPGTGALSIYFDGSAYGLQELDLRDFELLAEGGFIFTGNKPFTVNNTNGTVPGTLPPLEVDDSDIVRYHADTDSFSLFLAGSEIGLTSDGEDIDALAFAADGRLLISTIGGATVNGPTGEVKANDEDLIACDLGLSPVTCVLYFEGSDVRLNDGSEDLMAAWVDPTSETHYFSTKGSFDVEGSDGNSVENDREVVFGCRPLSAEESTGLTDCDFFEFFDSEDAFDTEKQIDGMWLGADIPANSTPTRSAAPVANFSLSSEKALDSQELANALTESQQVDPEIDIYDFVDLAQQLYLPVVER